jgi:hypothetical protein
MTRTSALVSALALALCACGASMKSYQPVNEKTKLSEDDLFRASVSALEARDYIAISDRDRYFVETREKEVAVSSVPRLSYKYTWQIQTKDSTLSITSTCKENSSTQRTVFDDCGDERPEKLLEEQAELQRDIMERAKHASAPEPDYEDPPVEEAKAAESKKPGKKR